MAKGKKARPAKKAMVPNARQRAAIRKSESVPPYKCERTLEPGICLKFYLEATTGQYNQPPGGERVPCSTCKYFFGS
jgi:hypothetical protein